MKKYKVFVDSNGKDSLWFCAGEKVENPLVPEKQEEPRHEPSVEELNGEILMSMFNLTGILRNVNLQYEHHDTVRVTFEEFLPDKSYFNRHTLDILTVDVKEVNCSYTGGVKPELQPDGSYFK